MDAPTTRTERRNLAILFADLSGSTQISGVLEPEQFADLLEQLRSVYDDIIARHGGLIVRIDGDGVICAFGYPRALEDAGRRATEAALDLHAAVAALDQSFAFPGREIRLHSGVHSGVVLVREGDLVRGRIEILGDATNIAARLCDHATADQIVVSEASLGADRHFFETAANLQVPVKGRKLPVSALLVSGRAEAPTRLAARAHRGLARFCGRTAELGKLRALLDESRAGTVRTVLINGPPGIGKSRLLGEFLDTAAADGTPVYRGYCEAYLGARPLQAFEQIVDSLPHFLSSGESGLPALMLDWVRASADQPAILAIDDWQWADDATHALLEEITRARTGQLLIVLASRPHAQQQLDEARVQIMLGPLSNPEAETAIAGLLHSPDPFRIERIRELSGGSPLFIEELCHSQSRRLPGQPGSDSSVWLDTLVQTRFLDLPPRQAELVRIAAVIGHMVPLGLFAAATGIGANDPALSELIASDFLYPGEVEGVLRFKHALNRDAIYRTVGLDDRRRLHALVADRLEALAAQEGEADHSDALAYHHTAAGHTERAIHYSITAGDRALRVLALDRAQAHYRTAIELCGQSAIWKGDDARIYKLVHKFGLASVNDPSREQLLTLDSCRLTADANNLPQARALTKYWQGCILYGLGEAKAAIAQLQGAYDDAFALDHTDLQTHIKANLSQSYMLYCRYDLAQAMADAAILELRARSGSKPPSGLAYLLGCYAMLQADRGDFALAETTFASAFDLLIQTDDSVRVSLLTKQATASNWQGEYKRALRLSRSALEYSLRTRSRFNHAISKAIHGYADWKLSRDQAALKRLHETANWFRTEESFHRSSLNFGWLCEALDEAGEYQQVEEFAKQAYRLARKGDFLGTAQAARALAAQALRTGQPERAQRYLGHAARFGQIRQSRHEQVRTQLAQAALLGPAEAAALLALTATQARAIGMIGHAAAAEDQRARITANR